MFKFLNKKIFINISLFLGQMFLVTKVLALEYTPLEPKAFGTAEPLTKATTLTVFLTEAFNLGLAICAALAVVMIVWGGVEYMLSESVFSKDEGKKKIKNAIYGLILALFSWLILYIINPSILDWSRFGTQQDGVNDFTKEVNNIVQENNQESNWDAKNKENKKKADEEAYNQFLRDNDLQTEEQKDADTLKELEKELGEDSPDQIDIGNI